MRLIDLLAKISYTSSADLSSLTVSGISHDSRRVCAGYLFVAIPCQALLNHVEEAIGKGASVVLTASSWVKRIQSLFPAVILIDVANPRLALAQLTTAFYSRQPPVSVAVTGTNGKSSVVSFVRQIWLYGGYKAASLGTLGLDTDVVLPLTLALPSLTTPDPVSLHRTLDEAVAYGVTHMAFEASSHGLDQYRLHGVQLTAAAWTSFSQDHLDYHRTMEAYFSAKERLFSEVLKPGKTAVLHRSLPHFDRLRDAITQRQQALLTYGVEQEADIIAENVQFKEQHICFSLVNRGRRWDDLILNMVGSFQLENALCAVGLALAAGSKMEDIVASIPQWQNVDGRMEYVGCTSNGARIYVDYAHTADALASVLKSFRAHLKSQGGGRLLVVFGCGGDRDKDKRAKMGKVAAQGADKVFITDDNPRMEESALIRQQILSGCSTGIEIPSRRLAIMEAMEALQSKDILVIAGKGHEQGQIIGHQILPFDDRQAVLSLLQG